MNRYVVDPEWHAFIIAYFYLGGIAAGAYAMASLAALFGTEEDRRSTRAAYYLAFPLVSVCGVLLIIDLGRPERFLHMLIKSNTWTPMFKWWSPMSVGSWGLSAFGGFAFASFLGVLAEDGRLGLGRWSGLARKLGQGPFAKAFQVGGSLAGFFLGGYTGALLSASNQAVWADSTWIAPLFLASAASTGIAATLLLGRWLGESPSGDSVHRLERLDRFAIGLELALLAIFAISLGGYWRPILLRWPGVLIPAFVLPVGLLAPLIVHGIGWRRAALAAPMLVLAGGLALRVAVVLAPGPWVIANRWGG
jgi:formate-dependent nitrite reductase membrane component NrfD